MDEIHNMNLDDFLEEFGCSERYIKERKGISTEESIDLEQLEAGLTPFQRKWLDDVVSGEFDRQREEFEETKIFTRRVNNKEDFYWEQLGRSQAFDM